MITVNKSRYKTINNEFGSILNKSTTKFFDILKTASDSYIYKLSIYYYAVTK